MYSVTSKSLVNKKYLKFCLLLSLFIGLYQSEAQANNSCRDLQGEAKLTCLRQNYVARAQSIRERIGECDQMVSAPDATESQFRRAGLCLSRASQSETPSPVQPAEAVINSSVREPRAESENYCSYYVAHESLVQRAGGTRPAEAFDIMRVRDEQERLRRADRPLFERNVNICISSIERDPNFLMQIIAMSEQSLGVVKTTQGSAPSAQEPGDARRPARQGQ